MNALPQHLVVLEWVLLLLTLVVLVGYEWYVQRRRRRDPLKFARSANAKVRENWVRSLMSQPGHEVLAVQTLRNSVMSSTITASTAVLALMGVISQFSSSLLPHLQLAPDGSLQSPPLQVILVLAMVILLFTAFARSTLAVRFYNHTGYIMGTQFDYRGNLPLTELAVAYAVRAGSHYSSSLRCFLMLIPWLVALLHPLLLLPTTLVLLYVLNWFDRAPAQVRGA